MNKFYKDFPTFFSLLLVLLLLLIVITKSHLFLVLLLIGAGALMVNPVYLIPVLVISSLSGRYFDIGSGISISRVIGIFFVLGTILFYNRKLTIKKNHFIIIIVIFFLNLFSSVFSITGTYVAFFQMLPNLAIALICSGMEFKDIRKITILLIISAAFSVIFIALSIKGNLVMIQAQRLTAEQGLNANRFAMMLAQLTAIMMAGFAITKQLKLKLILLPLIFISYFMLILSGSRSATIGITFSSLIIFLFLFRKQRKKVFISVVSLFLAGAFFYHFIVHLNIPFLNRFTLQNVIRSGGTGRFQIWMTLVPYNLIHHFFFGVGFGGGNVYELAYRHGLFHAAHNFFIDLFLEVGIVGFLIYIYYFIKVGKIIRKKLSNPLMLLPLWMFLTAVFNGIGETIFYDKLFWIGIALAWLFANNIQTTENSNIMDYVQST